MRCKMTEKCEFDLKSYVYIDSETYYCKCIFYILQNTIIDIFCAYSKIIISRNNYL